MEKFLSKDIEVISIGGHIYKTKNIIKLIDLPVSYKLDGFDTASIGSIRSHQERD